MNMIELTAKLQKIVSDNSEYTTWTISTPHLLMLVEQAVAEEREACAKVCEDTEFDSDADFYRPNFAAAIRARTMAFDSGALTSDPGPLRQRGTK